ncbi:hypothetical protein BDA96_01G253100 [Sorghum bicolor]|uniref:Uncharacterized protein n=1 Tax=Sorghum bicolor TaxID=4558 RepID=A0A921S0N0_SORBI|nr:hypothetical protein BDA96_01G253100 [Sorghum bicolor]
MGKAHPAGLCADEATTTYSLTHCSQSHRQPGSDRSAQPTHPRAPASLAAGMAGFINLQIHLRAQFVYWWSLTMLPSAKNNAPFPVQYKASTDFVAQSDWQRNLKQCFVYADPQTLHFFSGVKAGTFRILGNGQTVGLSV